MYYPDAASRLQPLPHVPPHAQPQRSPLHGNVRLLNFQTDSSFNSSRREIRFTTGQLLHGDMKSILALDGQAQGRVVAQLGGCDPHQLALCARACQDAGYYEVNLNCGCPSEATQKGSFGAVLMKNPSLVAACVRAMSDSCGIPVTVKHRLGLGYSEDYSFVRDFVGRVSDAGARVFVAHARNAVLEGLSPRQNRR